MIKRIILLALLSSPLFAQVVQSGYVTYVTSAPSGSCSQNNRVRVVMGPGTVYTCQSGTWAQVGGGGGGGVTSFSGDGTILSNSASTGAVTATLANTPTGTGGVVLATSPTLVTPALGTPSSVTLTNGTGLPESGVTNLTSDLALKAPLASPTFTGTVTLPAVTNTGIFTSSTAGASSASAFNLTGTPFSGTGTTAAPLLYFNNAVTQPSSWSTAGTYLGFNAASGSTADFISGHINGTGTQFSISSTGLALFNGGVITGAAASLHWLSSTQMFSTADGIIRFTNNAGTAFTRLQFGLITSSGPAFGISGTTITAQLGDGTAGGILAASAFAAKGTKFTASGCSNSTTVGGATAGKFTSGTTGACAVTITMGDTSTAPNGWSCWASDRTTPANIYDQNGDSTTTATFTGTTVSGDVISFGCIAY